MKLDHRITAVATLAAAPAPADTTMEELIASAETIPLSSVPALLVQTCRLQSVLADRLARSRSEEAEAERSHEPDDDRYLSIRELATRIPYAEKTIRNLMAMEELVEGVHWFKRRGRVMFLWPAMRKWVEQRGGSAPEKLPLVRSQRYGCAG